jgi:superfamily II DNA or RNA helicase
MELRPHQIKAIEMLRESLRKGNKRPILAAPCSFGKTITAAYMLSEAAKKGRRCVFICDRIKLVQQALEAFDLNGLDVGVIQGNHERTNWDAPIQIASIQTMSRRSRMIEFDFAIVDECHTHYKGLQKYMDAYTAVPFIGLSATPYAKGLGKHYDDIVVPVTPRDLLSHGYLCPVDYYGGHSVDTKGIKKRALPTGGTDFDPKALSSAIEEDQKLVGDIIQNWIKHGQDRQTIAFTPSIKHSKQMVDMFEAAGIPAVHIDGYMDDEERQMIFRAHDRGEFKILSCSRLLNTGYDAPKVSCLIDCFPTNSIISFVQRAGRIMRTAEGKENAIYLDHAGNVQKHGFAEDIIPESLDDGTKKFNERSQTKEKKEPKVRKCPQCYQEMVGIRCKCGYEVPQREQLISDSQELQKLTKANNKNFTNEQKAQWLGELYCFAAQKGYKSGYASHLYKKKFGVWPNKIIPRLSNEVSPEVMGFIKHHQIKMALGRKNDRTILRKTG